MVAGFASCNSLFYRRKPTPACSISEGSSCRMAPRAPRRRLSSDSSHFPNLQSGLRKGAASDSEGGLARPPSLVASGACEGYAVPTPERRIPMMPTEASPRRRGMTLGLRHSSLSRQTGCSSLQSRSQRSGNGFPKGICRTLGMSCETRLNDDRTEVPAASKIPGFRQLHALGRRWPRIRHTHLPGEPRVHRLVRPVASEDHRTHMVCDGASRYA